MAENSTEKTSNGRRTGRIWHVILAAVVLLLLNGLVLYGFTLVEQTTKLERRVSDSMDRLYTSITAAENASEGLQHPQKRGPAAAVAGPDFAQKLSIQILCANCTMISASIAFPILVQFAQ